MSAAIHVDIRDVAAFILSRLEDGDLTPEQANDLRRVCETAVANADQSERENG